MCTIYQGTESENSVSWTKLNFRTPSPFALSPFALVLLLALASAAGGCAARTLPPEPAAAALYRDIERLVGLRQAAGWEIDRIEIEGMLPKMLMSACQVEPARRTLLLDWLDARIAALGGPVARAYEERGRDLGQVKELLALTRIRLALARTMDAATTDCPFWLASRPGFRGRQISDDRWQLSASGGGKAVISLRGDTRDLQFGGAGRLMLGRNIGSRLAIYGGMELGGSAGFPRDEDGNRSNLVVVGDAVIPAIVRYRMVNTYLEVEAGYLGRGTEEDWTDVEHGLHLGISMGGRSSRVRWFFPNAVISVSYERTFSAGQPALNMIKMGFRAGAELDL